MSNGRRDLKNGDKAFIADIARSFHVEKASNKAAHIEKKNNPSARREVEDKTQKRKKHTTSGGSVWITFKGGFAGVPLLSSDAKQRAKAEAEISARASFRGKLSEKALKAAVEHATDYLSSAKDQAAEAGLHYTGESAAHAKIAAKASATEGDAPIDYTEGDAYLKEQQSIALKNINKLQKAPVGSYLASLIGTSGAVSPILPGAFASKEDKDSFASAVAQQSKLTGDPLDQDAARAPMYFAISQRQEGTVDSTDTANGNNVCIVRCKASGNAAPATTNGTAARRKSKEERGKKSTVIFRAKSKVSTFVQSFMANIIRKEMSGAMKIRDGADGLASSLTASPAKTAPAAKGGKKGRR